RDPARAFDVILSQAKVRSHFELQIARFARDDTMSTPALAIRELPRSDRPRERLIDLGVGAVSTAELLAIVLGAGGRGQSVLRVGQEILGAAHGSLRRLAASPVAELTTHVGVGRARA